MLPAVKDYCDLALPKIVAAFGAGMEIFVDSGARRGSDIAKACALGARAVFLGRAPLYGLASNGQREVSEVLEILRNEFEITLRLLGRTGVAQLDTTTLSPDWQERLRRL